MQHEGFRVEEDYIPEEEVVKYRDFQVVPPSATDDELGFDHAHTKIGFHGEAANEEELVESKESRKPRISDEDTREWLLAIPAQRDYEIISRLVGRGAIGVTEGKPVVNIEEIRKVSFDKDCAASRNEVFEALQHNGLISSEMGREEFDKLVPEKSRGHQKGIFRVPLPIPDSFGDMLNGISGECEYRGEQGGYTGTVLLKDGTETNPIEIMVANAIKESGVKRGQTGKLEFPDGRRATLDLLFENVLHRKMFDMGGVNSADIFDQYLPNLRKTGLVTNEDIRNSASVGETRMIIRRRNTSDVVARTPIGSAKYYFGNKTYVHNKEIIPDDTSIVPLDASTIGIMEEVNGIPLLKYSFSAMTEEEDSAERLRIAEMLGKNPNEVTRAEMTMRRRKKLSAEEIQSYDVTDFITPYNGEDNKAYAKRILFASNTELVINTLNGVFSRARIDPFAFSWGKKIRLAEVVGQLEKEKVVEFAEQYGEAGLQVLLAGESDRDWAKSILDRASTEDMRDIFREFAPLISDEDEFATALRSTLIEGDGVKEYLSDLRRDSVSEILREIKRVISGEEDLESVSQKFSGQHSKSILIKVLKRSGHIGSLEEIKGVHIENVSAPELSDEKRAQMEAIYRSNYSDNLEFQKVLMDKWSAVSHDPRTEFTVLEHEGNLAGFYRMEETAFGKKYFGSFNLDQSYRGVALGEALLTESIGEVAQTNIIEGDCDVRNPITSKYIESGFVGVDNYDVKGIPAFHIIRNDQLRKEIFSQSVFLSEAEIIAKVKVGDVVEEGELLYASQNIRDCQSLPFEQLRSQGDPRMVLTRYVRSATKEGETVMYAVFEKVSAEKLDEFMNGKKDTAPAEIEEVMEGDAGKETAVA